MTRGVERRGGKQGLMKEGGEGDLLLGHLACHLISQNHLYFTPPPPPPGLRIHADLLVLANGRKERVQGCFRHKNSPPH